MKVVRMLVCVSFTGLASAQAQQSPFSEAPVVRGIGDAATPTLADVMLLTQLRHIKVWFAGQGNNWELLRHETVALQEALIRAAVLYQGIPVDEVSKIQQPVAALIEAASASDKAKFQAAYTSLNAACNSCHEAGKVEYIRIQTPSNSPFSNQKSTVTPR